MSWSCYVAQASFQLEVPPSQLPEPQDPPRSQQGTHKLVGDTRGHHAPHRPESPLLSSLIFFSQVYAVYVQDTQHHDISHSPNSTISKFHTEPLAWFRVEEYSGLTGRKGTTVVSVTKVLWFCVASQTSRKKRAKRQVSSHLWCHGSAGRHGSCTEGDWGSTLGRQHVQEYMSTHGL